MESLAKGDHGIYTKCSSKDLRALTITDSLCHIPSYSSKGPVNVIERGGSVTLPTVL